MNLQRRSLQMAPSSKNLLGGAERRSASADAYADQLNGIYFNQSSSDDVYASQQDAATVKDDHGKERGRGRATQIKNDFYRLESGTSMDE